MATQSPVSSEDIIIGQSCCFFLDGINLRIKKTVAASTTDSESETSPELLNYLFSFQSFSLIIATQSGSGSAPLNTAT